MNVAAGGGRGNWAELVRAAVVGTQRAAAPRPEIGEASFDALLESDATPENSLLRSAAVLGLLRRAGAVVPDAPASALDPAPEEVLRRCSRAAAADLRGLLDVASDGPLLREWLALAARSRARAPEELLPRLLALGANRSDARPAIVAVLGERGRWLARQHVQWAYATDGYDPEQAWREGDMAARVRALRVLRGRDPEAARELLAAGWEREAPAERAAFLEALAEGLSAADEPFIEAALDGRRKDVRSAAAALLGRLPESRFAGRAIARAERCIRIVSGFLRKPSFVVHLPPECDAAMERDGIERRPPPGTGERAWWLWQLLARVPPAHWNAASGLDAATLLEAVAHSDFSEFLWRGFQRATVAYGDDVWRSAWIGIAMTGSGSLLFALAANQGAPPSVLRRDALARALGSSSSVAAQLTLTFPGPWDEAFSRAVARFVARAIPATKHDAALHLATRHLLPFAALHVPPGARELEEDWPEKAPDEALTVALDGFRETIRFRAAMRVHLEAETSA